MANSGLAAKINILCLLAAILAVLVLPFKKEIWYDESVSILCSKGISHATPVLFGDATTINSATLEQLNTAGNVFTATVTDNGNSFVYNILLHWFTLLFGNSIPVYMLFSKLCGILLLIAFFILCSLSFGQSIFTAVGVLLLCADNTITGMSHEIRAYSMGAMFVTIAAIYFYKFIFQKDKPLYLFLLGLFSVAAVLSHFLSVYVVLVFLCGLVYYKRLSLFSIKNMLAMLLPVAIMAIFFYFLIPGLMIMSKQNQEIGVHKAVFGFSILEAFMTSIKFSAINFKAVFPAFIDKKPVGILSFLFIVALYIAGVRSAENGEEKRNLHLLFIAGISGSLFLFFLCVKSHHYTALYYRYFSFCIPFCCLFTTYLLYVLNNNARINSFVKLGLNGVIIAPAVVLFLLANGKAKTTVKYNHMAIAGEISRDSIAKIEVPDWRDAVLVQSVLPRGYKIEYVRNPANRYFTLYKANNTTEQMPVIRINE